MKKFLSLILLFGLLVAALPASMAMAQDGGEDYVTQADDWLSKIADKTYGNVSAYWAIMSATNLAQAEDDSYTKIENPDIIEVGSKLRLPSIEEAEAFMADFNIEEDVD